MCECMHVCQHLGGRVGTYRNGKRETDKMNIQFQFATEVQNIRASESLKKIY